MADMAPMANYYPDLGKGPRPDASLRTPKPKAKPRTLAQSAMPKPKSGPVDPASMMRRALAKTAAGGAVTANGQPGNLKAGGTWT